MACDLVPENDKMPNDPVELLQKAAVASVSAGAASLEEAEEFLEKAEAVASQVDKILKGNISLEELRQQDEQLRQQQKQKELRMRMKKIRMEEEANARDEEMRRGIEGLGLPSSDFDFYCVACKVEYKGIPGKPEQPLEAQEKPAERRCYRCGGPLEMREQRIASLNQKLKEAQQQEQQKLLRRQRFKQLQRTAAVARGRAAVGTPQVADAGVAAARLPTNYQKWEFFEPDSDPDEKSQLQRENERLLPPPKPTPELTALEKDLNKRSKQQRQLRLQAESLNAKGRQLALAGSWAAAAEAFAAAASARPDMLKTQTNLALALLKMEKWEEAEAAAGKVLDYAEFIRGGHDKCKDACFKALLRRAAARRQLLKLDEALKDAESAQLLSPDDAEAEALRRELLSLQRAVDAWQQRTGGCVREVADPKKASPVSPASSPDATSAGEEQSAQTERFFARVDRALSPHGGSGLLKDLPADLAQELRRRLATCAASRAAFCLRSPGAAAAAREKPLQLQLPRGPARCLLDFAAQDVRMHAMRLKGSRQTALVCSLVGTSDAAQNSCRQGDAGENGTAKGSCLALDLILCLCRSDSPPSLYNTLLLPTIPSLVRLVHDDEAAPASIAVLAELSAHTLTRQAAANAAVRCSAVLEALLHLASSSTACTDNQDMRAKTLCHLRLSPAACQLALQLRKTAAARRPQLLEEARTLLCNLSVESPVRSFALQLLNQQGIGDQVSQEFPLLVALFPDVAKDDPFSDADTLTDCEASLDLLLNLSKEAGIRRRVCNSHSLTTRLRSLLRSLIASVGVENSSLLKNQKALQGTLEVAWNSAAARAVMEQFEELKRLSNMPQCRRMLLKILGLFQNITCESSSENGDEATAEARATVSTFLRSLELENFAQLASALEGAAGAEKEAVLSRTFVIAARALAYQECAENAALHQLETAAANVIVSEAAPGERASSASVASAVRLLCSSAISQKLVLRAAQTSAGHGGRQLSLDQLLDTIQKLLPALLSRVQRHSSPSGQRRSPDAILTKEQPGDSSQRLSTPTEGEIEVGVLRQDEKDDEAALGNCLLLLSVVVKAQNSALSTEQAGSAPSPLRELRRLDLKAVICSAAAALDLGEKRHPQVVRNAAICVAAAATGNQRYSQLLREIHALDRLRDAAKLFTT